MAPRILPVLSIRQHEHGSNGLLISASHTNVFCAVCAETETILQVIDQSHYG